MSSSSTDKALPALKPKTEEFLYFLLWSCERLSRPTWRNLTESFEGWAYRNGFHRQLARLEKRRLVEAKNSSQGERVHRLTEAGRLLALGGRDAESCWQRPWDGRWRLVLFDVPSGQDTARNRLRSFLRGRGFGYLQNSVWITPDPLINEQRMLAGARVDVETLIMLEARPCAGETDAEIVAGAWDFDAINRRHAKHLEILRQIPLVRLQSATLAKAFRRWAQDERQSWLHAMSLDPLLPARLLPVGYLGRKALQERREVLARGSKQLFDFTAEDKS